jgi:hypothetical protein
MSAKHKGDCPHVCRECREGKHRNCTEDSFCEFWDEVLPYCACSDPFHLEGVEE